MKNIIMAVLLALTFTSCAKPPPKLTVRMADWNEVLATADRVVFKGDTNMLIVHSDVSDVPKKFTDQIEATMTWAVDYVRKMDHISTEVMSPADYAAFEAKKADGLKPFSWNIKPEKFIVYKFGKNSKTTGQEESASINLTFGAFQRNGEWFFATTYFKE